MPNFKRISQKWQAWLCWSVPACLYLIQYGLLIFPSSISVQLQHSLSLDPLDFGTFSAAFLLPYVLMQVPAGLLFDRFNAKHLFIIAAVIMMVGCGSLIIAHDFVTGVISRMIMGFGGSFIFVGTIYLARQWFNSLLFPLIVGLTEAMSGIGAIVFNLFFSDLVHRQGWRLIVLEIIFMLVLFCIFTVLWVKEARQTPKSKISWQRTQQKLKIALKNPVVWYAALFTGFGFVHFMVLINFWQVPFLEKQYHLQAIYAVLENSAAIIGFIIGGPFFGWLIRYFRTAHIMLAGAFIQLLSLMLIHYFNLSEMIEPAFLFVLGVAAGSDVLSFEMVKSVVPRGLFGMTTGIINMFFGGIGILISPLVGYLYQVTHGSIQVAVFPVVFCSSICVILGFLLCKVESDKDKRTVFHEKN